MNTNLKGRNAIVTGGGRGIGRAIALALAGAGCRVTVTARSSAEIGETRDLICATGGQAIAVAGDVTELDDVRRVLTEAQQHFGPVSILINNAGISGPFGPLWELDAREWWRTQEIHIRGAFLYLHETLPGMIAAGSGRIINIASLAGTIMPPYSTAYSQAKAGLIRLSAHAALEVADYGIRVFAVEPGTIHTRMAEEALASPDVQRWAPGLIELIEQSQRDSDPETGLANCSALCLKLLSGNYDSLNGQYIDVREDLDARLRQAVGTSRDATG